jgi:ADP-dependent NAD(P)H-hydrate dehydratase / NAD(P)H-hydrate epimerase
MSLRQVVTSAEMKKLDQATFKAKKISVYDLMRYAGNKVYLEMSSKQLCSKADEIIVLAGRGNNGGDALVIAEMLIADGYKVHPFLIDTNHHQSQENQKQVDFLIKKQVIIKQINHDQINDFHNALKRATCLIDGLLGIGFEDSLEPFYYELIKAINQAKIKVISIDLPSGLSAKNGLVKEIAIKASHTMVIGRYKVGNLIQDALDVQGELHFIDIDIIDEVSRKRTYIKQSDKLQIIAKRKYNTHKYDYGHVMVIGGSQGMMGAPILSAHAALRSGAGLSSFLVDENNYPFMSQYPLEIMVKPYKRDKPLSFYLDTKKTYIYGVGLGRDSESDVLEYLIDQKLNVLVDADGIIHLSRFMNKKLNHVIITPHLGELSRLINLNTIQCQNDILNLIENLAIQTKMTICFKGPCMIIANANETYFAQFGNPGLATAGSGDVLSGVIATFFAQKHSPIEAALKGSYLHGLAANIATQTYGEASLMATDIINNLHIAIKNTSS